ncbi:MAG: M23 family peptidase [Bacteroidetes bacterium]|nr:MAG: M23 family peptidase [Bacteroidota bacterium]
MTKIKYYYNEESCSYEPVKIPLKIKLFRITGYLFLAGIIASSSLFGYYKSNPTPKEDMLISNREKLNIQWGILKQEIMLINENIADLQLDDHELREILELSDLPAEIRDAGIGGDNQITNLKSQNLKFEEQIVNSYQKISKLKAQLKIEGLSLDTIAKYAAARDKFWAHIPAIQPVDHKDLRRFSPIYGMRLNPVLGKWMLHRGLDFMGERGVPIYATGDGVIQLAQMTYGGFGNLIIIDHGYGYQSRYAHLSRIQAFNVKKGDIVKRGQVIGYMGSTGRSAGIHLHYEVLKDKAHVNPIGFFQLELETEAYHKLLLLAKENTAPLD